MPPTFDDAFDPALPDALRTTSSAGVWTRAREDYQAGESASTVCERYRINRSTFFARAKAEGWRRSDMPSSDGPDPYVAEMEAALVFELMGRSVTPAYVLYRRAWAMVEIALLQRRRVEAQSWIRIARDLRKLALEETGASTWRRVEQLGEAAMPVQRDSERPAPSLSGGETEERIDAGAADPSRPTAEPAAAISTGAKPKLEEPDWGLLPYSILTSQKKLDAFLKGEFAEAWAALDSQDQSDRTADRHPPPNPPPVSPAQAGAQLRNGAGG